ncbi:hypothetical protein BC830DRAFT_1111863 [Chytriomyces sp. MP71]|nr:hypothetical protein BC830DRAFT_1111863 [Chytriomyces sp. MP71]
MVQYEASLSRATVVRGRRHAKCILPGEGLLMIVGPCSIHDGKAGMEYSGVVKRGLILPLQCDKLSTSKHSWTNTRMPSVSSCAPTF